MSRISAYPAHPGLRYRMSFVVLAFLLVSATAASARAQSTPGESPGAEHRGPPHRGILRFGSLEGPPSPAVMRDSIKVGGKELQQYTKRYDNHMAATKGARDSVRTSMQAVRAAFEKGDRSEARSRRETIERQRKQLADEDRKFEESLNNVLTKDQQTRYQQWQNKRRQEARDWWRQRRSAARRGGWGTHHDSAGTSGQPSDSGRGLTK